MLTEGAHSSTVHELNWKVSPDLCPVDFSHLPWPLGLSSTWIRFLPTTGFRFYECGILWTSPFLPLLWHLSVGLNSDTERFKIKNTERKNGVPRDICSQHHLFDHQLFSWALCLLGGERILHIKGTTQNSSPMLHIKGLGQLIFIRICFSLFSSSFHLPLQSLYVSSFRHQSGSWHPLMLRSSTLFSYQVISLGSHALSLNYAVSGGWRILGCFDERQQKTGR